MDCIITFKIFFKILGTLPLQAFLNEVNELRSDPFHFYLWLFFWNNRLHGFVYYTSASPRHCDYLTAHSCQLSSIEGFLILDLQDNLHPLEERHSFSKNQSLLHVDQV